jgi:hypothetical protein
MPLLIYELSKRLGSIWIPRRLNFDVPDQKE